MAGASGAHVDIRAEASMWVPQEAAGLCRRFVWEFDGYRLVPAPCRYMPGAACTSTQQRQSIGREGSTIRPVESVAKTKDVVCAWRVFLVEHERAGRSTVTLTPR